MLPNSGITKMKTFWLFDAVDFIMYLVIWLNKSNLESNITKIQTSNLQSVFTVKLLVSNCVHYTLVEVCTSLENKICLKISSSWSKFQFSKSRCANRFCLLMALTCTVILLHKKDWVGLGTWCNNNTFCYSDIVGCLVL